mmetsp:Transcript_81906/g.222327  ORF Transcript_81906/g.222327 Transcript_81906/m.222327 type:complete len:202 (-) Transcript_81906:883-1488(-)
MDDMAAQGTQLSGPICCHVVHETFGAVYDNCGPSLPDLGSLACAAMGASTFLAVRSREGLQRQRRQPRRWQAARRQRTGERRNAIGLLRGTSVAVSVLRRGCGRGRGRCPADRSRVGLPSASGSAGRSRRWRRRRKRRRQEAPEGAGESSAELPGQPVPWPRPSCCCLLLAQWHRPFSAAAKAEGAGLPDGAVARPAPVLR